MTSRKMNVLVYSGVGATSESVRHCLYTLRQLLSPGYAVIPVSSDIILQEPWFSTCALLVFPGGADLGYCRTFNGEGNRRIANYVRNGGSYLGCCAGGYYGSASCEFEVDDPKMRVVGDRELSFFPGVCRGLAFEGFKYSSEAGARAADVKIHTDAFKNVKAGVADTFKAYHNGGGVFVDAKKFDSKGVEVLASYTERLHVDAGEGNAAVICCKVGKGHAVLTGPHPEFAPSNLHPMPSIPSYASVIDDIQSTDKTRMDFMRLIFRKLGLQVNEEEQVVPSLSKLHLTSHNPTAVSELVASWSEIITIVDEDKYIKGATDVFQIEEPGSTWDVKELKKTVQIVAEKLPTLQGMIGHQIKQIDGSHQQKQESRENERQKTTEEEIRDCIDYTTSSVPDQILDYTKLVKTIILHSQELPSSKDVPFDHESFYRHLGAHHTALRNPSPSFGSTLLYGSVVTSTNTLLDKNPSLVRTLPTGFTMTATTQIAGRGRGGNVWIAPPGALMFSTVIHHAISLSQHAPVVFIQYLAALAVIRGIKDYSPGYDRLPVKLKWPNDIYAQVPGSSANPVVKIGGILVNSGYSADKFDVVCGIGINVANESPTTSLNLLAASQSPPLAKFSQEKLLASILAAFEALYSSFLHTGFERELEAEYCSAWLHTDQIVTLESEGGVKARIKGITRDWGLLLAEEIGGGDGGIAGKRISLQSDSNSFDFFRGLLRRKI